MGQREMIPVFLATPPTRMIVLPEEVQEAYWSAVSGSPGFAQRIVGGDMRAEGSERLPFQVVGTSGPSIMF